MTTYLPSTTRFVSLLVMLVTLQAIVGCSTEQKNTRTSNSTQFPVVVKGVIVIYQPAQLMTNAKYVGVRDPQLKSRDLIVEKLEKAMVSTVGPRLNNSGIRSKVLIANRDLSSELDGPAKSWRKVFVAPLSSKQICSAFGSCSNRLTVQLRMTADDSSAIVWSTEIEEPYIVSSFIYDKRYEELAEHIADAIMKAVKPEGGT